MDERRERVRAARGAQHVVGVLNVFNPVTECYVDGIGHRVAVLVRHRHHRGTHKPHAVDIRLLARDVLGTHVDGALHAHERRHHSRRGAVLARTCLRDKTSLAQALGNERLREDLVALVRSAVAQILALQEDARLALAAAFERQIRALGDGRRAPQVLATQAVELFLETRIGERVDVGLLQLVEHRVQLLRHILSAVLSEVGVE